MTTKEKASVYEDAARRVLREQDGSFIEARYQVARTLDMYGADMQSRNFWRAVQRELKRIEAEEEGA
jgi:hypothetical protein